MPQILKIQRPEGQCTAVWDVSETQDELLQKANLSEAEKEVFGGLHIEQRRKEWLAVRALLKTLHPGAPQIAYKENGKPYLKEHQDEISISHSGTYVAIALNHSATPGVDIELIHPRIHKIAVRFINDAEKPFLKEDTLTEQLCIIWACKEVLYKIHPKGMLSFKQNLLISPFTISDEGHLTGTIKTSEATTNHSLCYKRINNYILVFTDEYSGKIV